MILAASDAPWYTSDGFLGILATIVTCIVTIWFTFRSENPRRRLHVYMASSLPVVRTHEAMKNALEVRHQGRTLSQPHVVTVMVVSRGRKDISSDSFDGEKPIVANLGVPIIQQLQFDAVAKSRGVPVPKVVIDGTQVLIGPSMLAKRHTLTITALVEGEPRLSMEIPILDIDRLDEPPLPAFYRRGGLDVRKILILVCASLLLFYLVTQPVKAAAVVNAILDFLSNIFTG
jgi:hypothetical protein